MYSAAFLDFLAVENNFHAHDGADYYYLKTGTARNKLCTKHIQKHHTLRAKRRKTELQEW